MCRTRYVSQARVAVNTDTGVCCVTGGRGFLAGHVVNQLARAGRYKVIRAVDVFGGDADLVCKNGVRVEYRQASMSLLLLKCLFSRHDSLCIACHPIAESLLSVSLLLIVARWTSPTGELCW